ncbi:MAG: T9SS type A sorting domain-containing protein [Saprospiraceae bacterium]
MPTNYSTFWQADANGYRYKQIIKIIDTEDPVFDNCPSDVEICDLTANDGLFYNDAAYWDATIESHDLCEAPSELCVTVTDSCGGAEVNIRYLLFLDMDGDGVMETEISSTNQPAPNEIPYLGGTAFDHRPVVFNQKYRFAIDWTTTGNSRTACVRWDWLQQPANLNDNTLQGVVPQLPYGIHKIKWIAEDGCGNEAICEYTFEVKDCKKPTVVCLNGLSVNIMPTGMITLWGSDFLQYGEDNCTPADQLIYGVVESDQSTGSFPVDALGNPLTNVTFDCSELGPQPVQLWAMDAAGNADFCETYVIVQDNGGFCDPNSVAVAGVLVTEAQDGLEDASVELIIQPANGTPAVSLFKLTDNNGDYLFSSVLPMSANYEVIPMKDDNPLNGVSTYDLVLISKHILGLEPLNSPYKMIAADANKSNSITTFDIVELRKLILGIYSELPNNTSWRFVDEEFDFTDPINPFIDQFPETSTYIAGQTTFANDDFVSVKIGDVNGSAIANNLMQSDDRSNGTLLIDVAGSDVKVGELVDVEFSAAEAVLGYQFTLNLRGLEVLDIKPGAGMTLDNFAVFTDLDGKEGTAAITTSFDGNEVGSFTVRFRAKQDGRLSELLTVSSKITRAEAYNLDAEKLDVTLRFNGEVVTGLNFELYQNTPNPWMDKTQIGFYLPETGSVRLTIFDESGRMIYSQQGDFAKGYNAFSINRNLVDASGVLYYKVTTDTDEATMKMIQVK